MLRITKVVVSGSAGNGKTHTKYLLFNELEKLKEARKSTPLFVAPVRALSREIVGTGKQWHKVTYDELNEMLARSINEGVSMDHVEQPPTVTHDDDVVCKQQPESEGSKQMHNIMVEQTPSVTFDNDTSQSYHGSTESKHQPEPENPNPLQELKFPPESTPPPESNPSPKSKHPPESKKSEQREHVDRRTDDVDKSNDLSLTTTPSPVRKEVLRLMEIGKEFKQLLDLHWVSFIDSGGQPQFIELLPAFVKNTSVVMIVQKLHESLDTFPEIAYYDRQTGELCVTKFVSHLRNDQIIQHCVRTLSTEKHCRVMVIGTHKDAFETSEELSKSIDEKNHWLLENLKRTLGPKLVSYKPPDEVLFPLNAKTPDEEDFQVAVDIRKDIECDKDKHPPYKIPIAWFLLEQDMQKLNKSIISLKECHKLASSLHMTKVKVDAALEYLHKLNIILYYPSILPDVIFISPQVIVDKITELVAFSFELQAKTESEEVDKKWNRYKIFGEIEFKMLRETRFSQHYIPDIFSPAELVKIFTSLLIMAPVTDADIPTTSSVYFMPSLLPEIVAENLDGFRPNVPFLSAAVLLFSNGCAPSGTFSRLCVYLISRCGWKRADALHRNCVQFYMGVEPCKVTIIDAFEWLEVYLEARRDVAFNVCYNILKFIQHGLEEASKALQQDDIAYQLAVMCPNRGNGECKSALHAAIVNSTIQYWTCTDNCQIYGELQRKQSVWFSQSIPLPGVQFISQGVLTILKSEELQTLEWDKHGLKIHVPPGALSKSDTHCEITVAVSLSGSFKLPDKHTLVSPIYYIQPSKKLEKPVTLELEHFCSLKTEDDTKALVPIFAQSSTKEPPYSFAPLSGGKFTVNYNWGRFDVTTFSLYGISWLLGTVPKKPPVLYSGLIYYRSIDGSIEWFSIKLVVIPRIKECIEVCMFTHIYT